MLPIQITDLWCKQLLASSIKCIRFTVSFIISYTHSATYMTPRCVTCSASPAIPLTLTAYAAVILHLPSDLALPFDVKSFPQKDEP